MSISASCTQRRARIGLKQATDGEALVGVVRLGAMASRTVHHETQTGNGRHSMASADQVHRRFGYPPTMRRVYGLTRTDAWRRKSGSSR